MHGARLDTLPPYKRGVNTVFQHYALFPHLNVSENVAYGLQAANTPKAEITMRVHDALAMVRMEEFAAAKPARLSGGQQQRVALAGHSSIARNCSCSTNRSPPSTPTFAKRCSQS